MARPVSDLLADHDGLDEDFHLHQVAILDGDLDSAARHFERFDRALRLHIRIEEEVVLPAFEGLGIECERGGAELYRSEHERILRWLEELRPSQSSAQEGGRRTPAEVLALLEREALFKRLLEHHDLRERTYLYPLLDEHMEKHQRELLWQRIDRLRV